MRIIWMPLANDNLNRIYNYYAQYSASLASRIINNIFERVILLESHPAAGWVIEGLINYPHTFRSLIACKGRYKIVYYYSEEIIYIYAIWDCRQNPDHLFLK